jgi:hypothetical protein
MKIMYVGSEAFVDVPTMPGTEDRAGGRIGRLQGADVPDALAHELLKTSDWEVANESYTPPPPDTDDEDELRAGGYNADDLAAAKRAARDYDTQGSAKRALEDPDVKIAPEVIKEALKDNKAK